jgi:hypothetical protein
MDDVEGVKILDPTGTDTKSLCGKWFELRLNSQRKMPQFHKKQTKKPN